MLFKIILIRDFWNGRQNYHFITDNKRELEPIYSDNFAIIFPVFVS